MSSWKDDPNKLNEFMLAQMSSNCMPCCSSHLFLAKSHLAGIMCSCNSKTMNKTSLSKFATVPHIDSALDIFFDFDFAAQNDVVLDIDHFEIFRLHIVVVGFVARRKLDDSKPVALGMKLCSRNSLKRSYLVCLRSKRLAATRKCYTRASKSEGFYSSQPQLLNWPL
jgi:hypothetical protein